jgi:parallel beta-helix repeat protein
MRNGNAVFPEPPEVEKPLDRGMPAKIFLFLLLGTIVSWCNPVLGEPLVVEKGIISSDTTWGERVIIKGDVEIAQGATLTVLPGTVITFAKVEADGPANFKNETHLFPRAELTVKGKILAQGTRDRMIVFTSAEDAPHPGDWGAINLLNTKGSIIEFCDISYAHTGVHCHGSQFTIVNCYLHNNGIAIGQKDVKEFETKCFVPILYNRITKNGGGILFGYSTSPTISHNQINDNELFGIYGKKGGFANITYNDIIGNGKGVILYAVEGLQLSANNIADNGDYNVSLLEGQIHDIDARHNWWGSTGTERIRNLIWDKDEDNALGRVDSSEFAGAPVAGAGIP